MVLLLFRTHDGNLKENGVDELPSKLIDGKACISLFACEDSMPIDEITQKVSDRYARAVSTGEQMCCPTSYDMVDLQSFIPEESPQDFVWLWDAGRAQDRLPGGNRAGYRFRRRDRLF